MMLLCWYFAAVNVAVADAVEWLRPTAQLRYPCTGVSRQACRGASVSAETDTDSMAARHVRPGDRRCVRQTQDSD